MSIEQARKCCQTCRIVFQTASALRGQGDQDPKNGNKSTPGSAGSAAPRLPAVVRQLLSGGQQPASQSRQKKIMFEFKPFMDGCYKLKELVNKSIETNVDVYNVLDNQIGSAVYKRTNKQIKADEFEETIQEAMKVLKGRLSKASVLHALQTLLLESDAHMLHQALLFSNLPYEERRQVELHYQQLLKKLNLKTIETAADDSQGSLVKQRYQLWQEQNEALTEEIEKVIAENGSLIEKQHISEVQWRAKEEALTSGKQDLELKLREALKDYRSLAAQFDKYKHKVEMESTAQTTQVLQ